MKCRALWGYVLSVYTLHYLWTISQKPELAPQLPEHDALTVPFIPPQTMATKAATFLLGPRWCKSRVATGWHTQSSGKSAVWMGKLCHKRCHFSVKWLNGCSTSNLFPWQCRNSSGNTGSFLLGSQYKEENKSLFSIWMNKRRSIFQCKHVKPKSFPCPDHSKIHE